VDSTYTLQENTISDITKNFEKISKWKATKSSEDIGSYVDEYMKSKWRLPKTSKPSHYKIHLDARNVQTGALPYSGEVIITAEITEETDFIVLHTKNQEFQEFKVINPDTLYEIPVLFKTFQVEYDQVSIYFDRILPVGTKMEIHAKYTTELLDEIDGFYQDFYIDNSGNKKYLATTQFQAVEARRAFPCYDGNFYSRSIKNY
jgi:aminopeptidase N